MTEKGLLQYLLLDSLPPMIHQSWYSPSGDTWEEYPAHALPQTGLFPLFRHPNDFIFGDFTIRQECTDTTTVVCHFALLRKSKRILASFGLC